MLGISRRVPLLFLLGGALTIAATLVLLSVLSVTTDTPPVSVLGAVVADASELPAFDPATVVLVRARSCDGISVGSGVLLDGGRVLTARHVVAGAGTATVVIDGRSVAAKVAALDAGGRDVALLELRDIVLPGARVAANEPRVDEPVLILGHPTGGPLEQFTGQVRGFVTNGPLMLDGARVMTVDVGVPYGMSGGAVFDGRGELAGIVIGVERRSQTSIAVPVRDIQALVGGRGQVPVSGCTSR